MTAILVVGSGRFDAVAVQPVVQPFFVARVAGLPTRVVNALRASRTMSLIAAIDDIDARLREQRGAVAELLFNAIGSVADKRLRNRLVQLRRDIFNGRAPRANDVASATDVLDYGGRAGLASLTNLVGRHGMLVDELRQTYGEELRDARLRFQAALEDEDFRRGLLVSSPTLSRNLMKYVALPSGTFGAREEQIERGLLRYFTRTAMKATPFATLCAVVPGRLDRDHVGEWRGSAAHYVGDPRSKRGFIRLNKNLYRALWTHLKSRPMVRSALRVELNPTLTIEEDVIRFLTANQGQEIFQRLPANEALTRLLPTLRRNGGARVRDLCEILRDDPEIDATMEEASAYVDQLIEIGLLRFRSGVRDQDADWDLALREMLAPIDDDHARRIASLVCELRSQIETYAWASTADRAQIGSAVHERLTEEIAALGLRGYIRSDLPFYEDASAAAELFIDATDAVATAFDRLGEFLETMMPLALPRGQQATLRHFFDDRYGADRAVPLLQFYEDFYREHYKAHLEKEALARARGAAAIGDYDLKNPFSVVSIRQIDRARAAISELILDRWRAAPHASEIALTRTELMKAVSVVDPPSRRHRSVNVFCQLDAPARPGNGAAARLHVFGGTYFTGYGKFFSRFLYMFPEQHAADLYTSNNASRVEWLAEICADGDFNANLHPPLLRWEISYPTAEGGSIDGQLLISELDVVRAADDPHELRLIHRVTGNIVVPFDLGFLSSRSRPPLFQLLSLFSSVVANSIQIPETVGATYPQRQSTVSSTVAYRPRITYESVVVLARRRWLVPFAAFPHRVQTESDAAYFLRVNQWRKTAQIPEQVYIRVHPTPSPVDAAAAKETERSTAVPTEMTQGGEKGADALADHAENDEEALKPDVETEPIEAPAFSDANAKRAVPALGPKVVTTGRPRQRDWRKPQFIDFGSPLLVKLFAQLSVALRAFNVTMEERLPDEDGLPEAGADRYVSEMIVQVDFPVHSSAPLSEP